MRINSIIPRLSFLCLLVVSNVSANVNMQDANGKTQVMNMVLQWKEGDSLNELNDAVLSPEFNPYIKDKSGKDLLYYVQQKKIKPIEYPLLKMKYKKLYKSHLKQPYSYYQRSGDHEVDLIRAISSGGYKGVTDFLSDNRDFNLNYDLPSGITPLSATALVRDVDIAGQLFMLLLDHGADPNYTPRSGAGDNIGHVFCSTDNYLMLLLSVSKGFDVHMRNTNGEDVYASSVKRGNRYCSSSIEKMLQ